VASFLDCCRRAVFERTVAAVEAPRDKELVPPRLPVRAAIYIAPDGRVHFGALFAELLPVAAALGASTATSTSTSTVTSASTTT
jgi:hypothetical protein